MINFKKHNTYCYENYSHKPLCLTSAKFIAR